MSVACNPEVVIVRFMMFSSVSEFVSYSITMNSCAEAVHRKKAAIIIAELPIPPTPDAAGFVPFRLLVSTRAVGSMGI